MADHYYVNDGTWFVCFNCKKPCPAPHAAAQVDGHCPVLPRHANIRQANEIMDELMMLKRLISDSRTLVALKVYMESAKPDDLININRRIQNFTAELLNLDELGVELLAKQDK